MLASILLSLREGLEGALIIGIAVGTLRKTGMDHLLPALWRGVFSALGLCLLAALAMNAIGTELEGNVEEIYEATTMLVAAAFLTWMILWMQKQSRNYRPELERTFRLAADQNNQRSIFWLAFLTIGREGFELALILVAARFTAGAWQTLIGALLGLGAAVLFGWLVVSGARRLNLKYFFAASNVLLVLFAAGLVASGFKALVEIGLVPALIEPIWNTSAWLDTSSLVGGLLKALFGYNSQPSLSELLAYLAYFAAILWASWRGTASTGGGEPNPA